MSIAPDATVAIPPDVLVRDLQGESVLLNLKSGLYFGLNETGTRMWAVLTASPSIRAAYETLQAEFSVQPDRLRQDLDSLIEKLSDQGLLEVHGG